MRKIHWKTVDRISMKVLFIVGLAFCWAGLTDTAQSLGFVCLVLWGINIVDKIYKE